MFTYYTVVNILKNPSNKGLYYIKYLYMMITVHTVVLTKKLD